MLIGVIGAMIPIGVIYVLYNKIIEYIMVKFSMLTRLLSFLPVEEVFHILLPVSVLMGVRLPMKRWKRLFCVALGFILVLGTASKYQVPAFASELTNDSIKQKEAEINKAKDEKKALQSGLTNVKEIKKQLEKSKAELADYVEELDAELVAIQNKINDLKNLITEKEEEIDQKAQELTEALSVQQAQYEAMKSRSFCLGQTALGIC